MINRTKKILASVGLMMTSNGLLGRPNISWNIFGILKEKMNCLTANFHFSNNGAFNSGIIKSKASGPVKGGGDPTDRQTD